MKPMTYLLNLIRCWRTNRMMTDREALQLKLELVHREAQKQDARHRAEIRADVAHRWPAVAAFLKGLQDA